MGTCRRLSHAHKEDAGRETGAVPELCRAEAELTELEERRALSAAAFATGLSSAAAVVSSSDAAFVFAATTGATTFSFLKLAPSSRVSRCDGTPAREPAAAAMAASMVPAAAAAPGAGTAAASVLSFSRRERARPRSMILTVSPGLGYVRLGLGASWGKG